MVIILLATVGLTLMVPAVSGISLLQQAKAAISGQNGRPGTNECIVCFKVYSQLKSQRNAKIKM